jgi:adenylate cyclase
MTPSPDHHVGKELTIDFEAEGLLAGLDDRHARESRLSLLRELSDAGCTLEQLKEAVDEDRLPGLPLELVFTRGLRFTVKDLINELGFDEGFVRRNYLALGLPVPPLDEPALDDDDMESWRMLKVLFDAGISEERILELARPSGRWAAQIVDILRQLFPETFFEPGVSERDFGVRLATLTSELMPTLGPLTERPVRLHLRDRVRHDVVRFTELTSGEPPGTREVGVCFADLVEFTRLSEQVSVEELGGITGRLEALAAEAAEPPVRLIKLIGDAAMLVSPDILALVAAAQTLVQAADEDKALPRLRAGIAAGRALSRGGDWYGPPVNLASRVTDVAEPGTIVASEEAVDAASGGYRWTALGEHSLKGVEGAVRLHRLAGGVDSP